MLTASSPPWSSARQTLLKSQRLGRHSIRVFLIIPRHNPSSPKGSPPPPPHLYASSPPTPSSSPPSPRAPHPSPRYLHQNCTRNAPDPPFACMRSKTASTLLLLSLLPLVDHAAANLSPQSPAATAPRRRAGTHSDATLESRCYATFDDCVAMTASCTGALGRRGVCQQTTPAHAPAAGAHAGSVQTCYSCVCGPGYTGNMCELVDYTTEIGIFLATNVIILVPLVITLVYFFCYFASDNFTADRIGGSCSSSSSSFSSSSSSSSSAAAAAARYQQQQQHHHHHHDYGSTRVDDDEYISQSHSSSASNRPLSQVRQRGNQHRYRGGLSGIGGGIPRDTQSRHDAPKPHDLEIIPLLRSAPFTGGAAAGGSTRGGSSSGDEEQSYSSVPTRSQRRRQKSKAQ